MNQNPEQLARDRIDEGLTASGWIIQSKKSFNLAAANGVAICEYYRVARLSKSTLFGIALTVDIIATGTDIRPLEVLLFMRDVKSRSYYEQMKGRCTRTCSLNELRTSGSPAAKYAKDHFVIIDAIGVGKSQKTDSRPLEKKPRLSLKEVLESIAMGARDEEMLTTLANRLI